MRVVVKLLELRLWCQGHHGRGQQQAEELQVILKIL